MDSIGSINSSATQAAAAIQAGQTNAEAGTTAAQSAASGLPPVLLAEAASRNTLNAELVSSRWGIDPAAVSGVYGGAAENGGLFSGDTLLPLLASLTHSTAEQALALIGVQTPTSGGAKTAASGTADTSSAATNAAQSQAALAGAASGSTAGMIVDPLWGRSA